MKRVLFLCTGNYYRSRFAEYLFNHLAKEKNLPWHADSCGLHVQPDGVVNPGPLSRWTHEAMVARNLPLPEPLRHPRQVTQTDLENADLVIAVKEAEHRAMMQHHHPEWADRIQYWHIHDLDQAPPHEGIREVEAHVRRLVEELFSRPAP